MPHAASSDSIKILLSSRPIPPCVQSFSACPKLRLQDLTSDDVKRYVEDKLGRDALMRKLEKADRAVTLQLNNGVTSKASGVLLWVVLVVRRLLNGLQDYDARSDLLQRLEEVPLDLERLYDHMLGCTSPQNCRQGSKMLQMVLRSTEAHGEYPIAVLQLSFAEGEDYAKAIRNDACGISPENEDWRCESTEGRMRSRCCGLLEVQSSSTAHLEQNNATKFVSFLHRTVVHFLRANTIWIQLVSLTEGSAFDVDEALLSCSLSEMKAKPLKSEQKQSNHRHAMPSCACYRTSKITKVSRTSFRASTCPN